MHIALYEVITGFWAHFVAKIKSPKKLAVYTTDDTKYILPCFGVISWEPKVPPPKLPPPINKALLRDY